MIDSFICWWGVVVFELISRLFLGERGVLLVLCISFNRLLIGKLVFNGGGIIIESILSSILLLFNFFEFDKNELLLLLFDIVENEDVLAAIVVKPSLICFVNQGWLNISGIVILVDGFISNNLRIKSLQSILISSAVL